MSFNTALTAGNYTSLRTGWKGEQYITLCENTEVFAARLNGDAGGSPIAQLTYDTVTTGAYTDIEIGQVILVSHTNDKRAAYFRGRIRTTPTNVLLYINETSVEFTDNDYVWVIDTYDLTDRLARPVSGVQYKDYDLAYQGLLPVVNGLRLAYVGWVDSGTGKLRIALNASTSYAAENGATISSYQYTFRAATYTVISGALNTHTVTIDLDPGVGQWGKLVVTDSGGRAQTLRFYCKAHDDTYPPDMDFDGASITGNLNEGFSANVPAFGDVSTTLDRTFTVIWVKETYDTETNIVNNIDCVGWLQREESTGKPDFTYSLVTDASFQIAGPGGMLGRLESQLLAIRSIDAPDEWDEIASLTPWRAVVHYLQRHTTLLNLCCLSFDVTDVSYAFPYLSTQGGNALATVGGILEQINAVLEFAPDGRLQAFRIAEQLSSAARNALTTVANWDNRDFVDPDGIAQVYDHVKRIGKMDADGAFYNTSSGNVTALRSRAPGYAQGEAESSGTLSNQILSSTIDQNNAQTELNQRSGNAFDIENNTVRLRVQHGAGYHFIIPSRVQWFTWTLTTAENNRGWSYTTATRWMAESISISHSNERGTRTVNVVYRLETGVATPGDTVPIIPDGTELPTLPEFPPFDAFPAFPDLVWPEDGWLPSEVPAGVTLGPDKGLAYTKDGNSVIIWSAAQAWIAHNFIKLKAPTWYEITPVPLGGTYEIKQIQIDPSYTNTAVPCYVLASDGTNSKVFYTANVCDKPPVWVEGAEYVGVYTVIRPSSTAGSIEIYSSSSDATVTEYDFTTGQQGWALRDVGEGQYSAGVGWIALSAESVPGSGNYSKRVVIQITLGAATTLIGMELLYDYTQGSAYNTDFRQALLGAGPNTATISYIQSDGSPPTSGTNKLENWTGSVSSVQALEVNVWASGVRNGSSSTDGAATLKRVRITTTAGGGANVRLSTDYGATFGSTITVGASAGAQAGFDLNYIGAASLAAADQQVKKATTLGGAYSNEANGAVTGGQPTLLLIPWYQFGSTTTKQFNNSSPQYLLGSSSEVSSNALWRVTGSGQTDITPAASTICIGPFSAMMWKGTKLGILVDVVGIRTLYTTSNAGGSPPTWTSRSTAVAGALYCRGRRKSSTGNQLYICGASILKYSGTFGAALYARTPPTSDSLLGIEVIG